MDGRGRVFDGFFQLATDHRPFPCKVRLAEHQATQLGRRDYRGRNPERLLVASA